MILNGGCKHICIPSTNKQKTCRCTTGYQPDGEKGCKAYDKFAIVSQLEMMRGYSLDGAGEAMTPVAGRGKFLIFALDNCIVVITYNLKNDEIS